MILITYKGNEEGRFPRREASVGKGCKGTVSIQGKGWISVHLKDQICIG
jgi:hypothetical protein